MDGQSILQGPARRPAQPTLSVIVPVYYNADSLPQLFEALAGFERQLDALNTKLELIFVDDGSKDNSFQLLMEFRGQRPGTKILKLSRNFGAPAATRAGHRGVTGDCFAYLPADLQEAPDQLLEMMPHWLAGHKFVVAVRVTRGDPLMTRVYAAMYYLLVRWAITADYPHTGIGLMLMDKIMLPLMGNSPQQINLNMYAHWLGFAPKVVTYHRNKREKGRSRWTFWRKFVYFIDTFTGFSPVPIRTMSALGLTMALASLAYAVTVFLSAIGGHVVVSGFATLAILISFFGGCTLFMLGVMGEYIWRIFIQVSGRPEAVVDEAYM